MGVTLELVRRFYLAILGLGTGLSGAASYVLASEQNTAGFGVIVTMFVLTVWFILRDREVDRYSDEQVHRTDP
jgi:hypothetical protein